MLMMMMMMMIVIACNHYNLTFLFGTAFFYLFRDSGATTDSFRTMPETFLSTFIMTNGEFNVSHTQTNCLNIFNISIVKLFRSSLGRGGGEE